MGSTYFRKGPSGLAADDVDGLHDEAQSFVGPWCAVGKDDVIDALGLECHTTSGELARTLFRTDPRAERDLDIGAVSPDLVTGLTEHVQLATQRRSAVGDVEQVASVGVAGDQRKRTSLAGASDEYPWPEQWSRLVERTL